MGRRGRGGGDGKGKSGRGTTEKVAAATSQKRNADEMEEAAAAEAPPEVAAASPPYSLPSDVGSAYDALEEGEEEEDEEEGEEEEEAGASDGCFDDESIVPSKLAAEPATPEPRPKKAKVASGRPQGKAVPPAKAAPAKAPPAKAAPEAPAAVVIPAAKPPPQPAKGGLPSRSTIEAKELPKELVGARCASCKKHINEDFLVCIHVLTHKPQTCFRNGQGGLV